MMPSTDRPKLADWPQRLAAVRAEPSDENLQRLVAIVDLADAALVRRWGRAGHDHRRSRLDTMRTEAADARVLVATASRAAKVDRARARAAGALDMKGQGER